MSAQAEPVIESGAAGEGLMLSQAEVGAMLEGLPTRTISRGTRIIAEGAKGAMMYYLKGGMVELTAGKQLLDVLEPGAIFGEMSLIDDQPRSANVIASTDCIVAEIDQNALLDLTIEEPRFAFFVMHSMARRVRLLNQIVAS